VVRTEKEIHIENVLVGLTVTKTEIILLWACSPTWACLWTIAS